MLICVCGCRLYLLSKILNGRKGKKNLMFTLTCIFSATNSFQRAVEKNSEFFSGGCLCVCSHWQCCRLSSLLSCRAHSVTSGMLSQRECLMNVENENTSLMNSVTQLVQLIFLWRRRVKWSHGWLSHCVTILFYFLAAAYVHAVCVFACV